MADKAIGSLVEATVINDADRFVMEQSGQAKQISGATMISELAEALDGHGGIQSIVLVGGEGNVKTYRITFTDGTTYDYEVRDGESGNYAVVAGNLAPYSDASGATQSIPFLSQGTGRGNGSAAVSAGNYCQLKKKLGNTVAVNQQIRNGNFADSSYWSPYDNSAIDLEIANGIGKVTFKTATGSYYRSMKQAFTPVIGHKYLLQLSIKVSAAGGYAIDIAGSAQGKQYTVSTANVWTDIYKIIDTAGGSASSNILFEPLTGVGGVGDTMEYRNIAFYDLTLWFGSPDRIPSDLLAHPENWGRYYAGSLAYNAGTLESADGSILKSINRNCWDGEHDVIAIPNQAYYCKGTATITYKDRDGNTISTASVTNASFTTPADCFSFGVSGTGVTISLYYSGESGYDEDYDFSVLAEVDTGSEELRSAGAVADEKTPDGTMPRRVGVVDLGTLNYILGSNKLLYTTELRLLTPSVNNNNAANVRMALYPRVSRSAAGYGPLVLVKGCGVDNGGYFFICDPDMTWATAAEAKAALSGAYLYYERVTPTTEQGTAFPENIPCDPVGSMSWENTKGIPQAAEMFYPFDYAGTLDSMLKALPSANGTYTFKATVANGKITYSWVAG